MISSFSQSRISFKNSETSPINSTRVGDKNIPNPSTVYMNYLLMTTDTPVLWCPDVPMTLSSTTKYKRLDGPLLGFF